MAKLSDFDKHSIVDNSDSLAFYLPGGNVFANARILETNIRKFFDGLSQELRRSECLIEDLVREYFPDTTESFIDEWESSVGIPDDCFDVASSLEERVSNVIIKLASLNVQTRQDFIDLALLFGFDVVIKGGTSFFGGFTYTFPINFPTSPRGDRHTMFVIFQPGTLEEIFPYTFPLKFGTGRQSTMECWFNKLVPANVKVIFQTS